MVSNQRIENRKGFWVEGICVGEGMSMVQSYSEIYFRYCAFRVLFRWKSRSLKRFSLNGHHIFFLSVTTSFLIFMLASTDVTLWRYLVSVYIIYTFFFFALIMTDPTSLHRSAEIEDLAHLSPQDINKPLINNQHINTKK